MTTWMRRRLADDRGMSLVEMMVSILILGVVLSAFASTLTTALMSLTRDEARVRATHLANEVAENLRATAWDDLGFYADDAGYAATYTDASGTHDTVELGPTRASSPGPLPGPQPVTTPDGMTYTTIIDVYWQDDELDGLAALDADGDLHDVKAFHVAVQWSVRGRSFELETDGLRPPTLDEVPLAPTPAPTSTIAPGTFGIVDFTVLPTAVTISPSGTTQQAMVASVTTSLPAIVPNLAYNGTSIGMQEVVGSSGTQWTHEIAAGNSTFMPAVYDFVVTATGVAGGTDTATQPVEFTQPVMIDVQVLTPTPAPGTVVLCTGSNKTLAPLTLQFDVLGLFNSPNDTVTMQWTDPAGSATAGFVASRAAGDGTVWEATIPAGTRFNKSVTTVTIRATRAVDGAVAAESYVYTVGSCP